MDENKLKSGKNWFFALLIVLGIGFYAYQNVHLALPAIHSNDFKHLYLGAQVLRFGGSPYDVEMLFIAADANSISTFNPYVYLPFTGIVMSPLTFIPFRTAAREWFVLNHLFFIAAIVMTLVAIREKMSLSTIAVLALYSGLLIPLFRTLTAGQLNCALLLLFALILYFYLRNIPLCAGFFTAFATLFKLSPGILLLFFLLKREWKILWWSLLWFYVFGFIRIFCTSEDSDILIYIALLSAYIAPPLICGAIAYFRKKIDIFIIGILAFYCSHIYLVFQLETLRKIEQNFESKSIVLKIIISYLVFFFIEALILAFLYPMIRKKTARVKNLAKLFLGILTVNATIVLAIAGAILLILLNVPNDFLPLLKDMGYGSSTWSEYGATFHVDPYNQSFNALFHHLFAKNAITTPLWNIGPEFANLLTKLCAFAVTAAALIFSRTRKDNDSHLTKSLQYSLFIFLSVLIPSLFWDHYIVMLMLPIIVMFVILKKPSHSLISKLLFTFAIVFIALPFDFHNPAYKQGAKILMLSFKLFFVIALFYLNCKLVSISPQRDKERDKEMAEFRVEN